MSRDRSDEIEKPRWPVCYATTDVMISELYAQISQLVSNPSTNVARFRYDVKKPMWMSRIHFLKARERTPAPPLPEKIVAL